MKKSKLIFDIFRLANSSLVMLLATALSPNARANPQQAEKTLDPEAESVLIEAKTCDLSRTGLLPEMSNAYCDQVDQALDQILQKSDPKELLKLYRKQNIQMEMVFGGGGGPSKGGAGRG